MIEHESVDSDARPIRRGVVAVIVRQSRLLVIRRSQHVAAPGALCFPGGGIEAGETEEEALVRELREELGVDVRPMRPLWRNVTAWRVDLTWWLAEMNHDAEPSPAPAEVDSICWLTRDELAAAHGLLESNRLFLDALAQGAISLDADGSSASSASSP